MQRIFSEGLDIALTKGLQPFYLITGQDLLLVGESKDKIVQAAKLQGAEEKNEYALANDTPWESLFEQAQSYGLFSSQQIMLLNAGDTLPAAQQKPLAELLNLSNPDLVFILHIPKFTKAMEKQAWFTQIQAQSVLINCQTPEASKLPMWLQHRAKAMQLTLEPEASKLLCYSYEGNLLAFKQALQLLQLRHPNEPIGLTKAEEVIEQSAQFSPFQWIDALLEGKIGRATRILQHLKNEELQPVILLRVIQKELMMLLEMTRSPQPISLHQPLYNGNLRAEFDRLKVWQNRRGLYQMAISRFSYAKLYALIQQLADLERKVKQEFSDEIWLELERFGLAFR